MSSFLDLRRLRYFMAIAEHGSLSAAARILRTAQPALSHHVAELERQIGAPLLERRSNGVSLTQAGRLLHRHATLIDRQVRLAEAELVAFVGAEDSKIPIRLAVISSISADLTPFLLRALARDMPEITLRITESSTSDSRELLDSGRADLAIHLAADEAQAPLTEERLYLVSAGNRAATPASLPDALREPLVLPARRNPLRELLEDAGARIGIPLNVVLEIDGPGSRRNAILAGHGSTVFGAHYLQNPERRNGLSVRPIGDPSLFRPIFLGARRGLAPALVARLRAALASAITEFGAAAQPYDEIGAAGHS